MKWGERSISPKKFSKKIYILARFITIMEQYWMPKKLDFKNLRLCLDNYSPTFIYIRLVGSMGGTVKVNEKLEDPNLPEPQKSTLRSVLDDHLIEIDFEGRINLKFHSWWDKPYWKYWTIDKPENI